MEYLKFGIVGGVLEDDGLAEELDMWGSEDVSTGLEGFIVVVLVGDNDTETVWAD